MALVENVKKKMCLVGDAAVGKTSLIRRFVVDRFDDKYLATIGTKTSKKTLAIKGKHVDVNLKLIIWDILGQRSFPKIQKLAYKNASGGFIVLDLTRKETLHSFDNWLSSVYKVTDEIPIVVLANKNDLRPEFGKDEIEELVKDYGFPYYFTSAKTGENVNDAFYTLGKMMVRPWECTKRGTQLDMSKVMGRYLETEMELGRKLTALEAEDMIIARYCHLLEDPDFAMAIVRTQFKKAGADIKYPTAQGLTQVVDYLINAASDRVEATSLEKEKRDYTNLIGRIS